MAKKRRGRSAAFMRSINPNLKRRRIKHKGATMARKKSRKHHFGKKGSKVKMMSVLLGAGAYGAVREKLSNALTPLTSKIPLGNIADEAVLFAGGYLLAKKTKGVLKDIGTAAMYIEAARLGEAVVNGQIGLGGSSAGTSNLWA